jgi:hypothetical protein
MALSSRPPAVIVSLHVATGAAAGAAAGSRRAAVPLGFALHLLGDVVPHRDFPSRRFEIATGVIGVSLLALGRGPLDPATVGAVACSIVDVEHVLRLPRPGGRKLFPSHRWSSLHQSGGLPARWQLFAAGLVLGALVATGRRARPFGPGPGVRPSDVSETA